MTTYEGHYTGCTSHPDHEGDCTVARSLPRRVESVGKVRLETLGLVEALDARAVTLTRLHEAEMTMFDVAKAIALLAVEVDTKTGPFLSGDPLPEVICTISERLRGLAAQLLVKP